MLRQSILKLQNCAITSRLASHYNYSTTKNPCSLCPEDQVKEKDENCKEKNPPKNDEMCSDHCNMIPDAKELQNLKSFEMKSNCKSFQLSSEGHKC